MMSSFAPWSLRSAGSRVGQAPQRELRPTDMQLVLPFSPAWTGGADLATTLTTLRPAGVTALELNLPPHLTPYAVAPWRSLVADHGDGWTFHLHAPLAPTNPAWPELYALVSELAARQSEPPFLVVHAPTSAQPITDTQALAAWLLQLLHTTPAPTKIALELGWNWGASAGAAAAWQRWRAQATRRALSAGRPTGVGSGQGAAPQPPVTERRAADVVDPPVDLGRWARFQRQGGYSAAGTRAATLAAVQAVGDPRVCIAWDLAHDWLGGPWSDTTEWSTVPPAPFLAHVGYVRLHDAADDGTDHLPLVVGNVPYTTQLRSLLRTPFDGPVCLAIRHTARAAQLGTRADLLAQSLKVARHVLRLG